MFKNTYLRYVFYAILIFITGYIFMVLTPVMLSGNSAKMITIIFIDILWFFGIIYIFVRGKSKKEK